jgi:microcystin-dependent protein
MEEYIGAIKMFASQAPFRPKNYLPCDGRLLGVKGWKALYCFLGEQ